MFREQKFFIQKNDVVEFNNNVSTTQSNNNIENTIPFQKLNLLDNQPVYRCSSQHVCYDNIKNNSFWVQSMIKTESAPVTCTIQKKKEIVQNDNKTKNQAPVWNEQFSTMLQGYESLMNSNGLLKSVKEMLNKMVDSNYVDWNESQPFVIQGRIYTIRDHAEFTCEIYELPQKNNNHKSMILITKKFGNGWVFGEFQSTLLKQLLNNNVIVFNEFMDICNDNKLNELQQLNQNFMDFDNSNTNDTFTLEVAKQILNDAVDCSQDRDILRENLLSFRLAVNDQSKIKIIFQIENIFSQLLKPIMGENQLYDTWVIKTILEIMTILREYALQQQQLFSFQVVCSMLFIIKKQWANTVPHPFGLSSFFPSQQIVRICDNFTA